MAFAHTKKFLSAAAVAAMAFTATAANAKVYDFSFIGSNYTAAGQFQTAATGNGDGTYNILGATGSISSLGAFTMVPGNGVLLTSADGRENYSNLYTPGATSFADAGLEVAGTGFEVNIYNAVNANYGKCSGPDCLSVDQPTGGLYDPGDIGVVSITAVPEPAIWAMMLVGFFGIGSMVRGSNRKAVVA